MSAVMKRLLTPQEYLAQERRAEFRSEYLRGEVFAMAGTTWEHCLVKDNLASEAGHQLKDGPCRVLTSDLRVKVNSTGLYTYPDLVIVCDKPTFEDEVFDTLLNPLAIVEILSDSTEKCDRGAKFAHYRTIPSLQEYVLVAQDQALVERFVRQPDGSWLLTAFADVVQVFEFASVSVRVPLADIYRGVKFAEAPAAAYPTEVDVGRIIMEYNVQLETFRGPLDLLLFLVKRHEVDIRDVPIAQIAEQFLQYLNVIQLIDVEWAGEFIVMAATLMEIKSRMLLPRNEEEPDEEDDPRLELVRQLIEYKKYKEAAALLEEQAERQQARLPRLPLEIPQPLDPSRQPLRHVELWDLVSAFGRLMRETNALLPRQIVMDETPIHVHMERIMEILGQKQKAAFSDIFAAPHSRGRLLGLFLAILELIKANKVHARQVELFGEIWLTLPETST